MKSYFVLTMVILCQSFATRLTADTTTTWRGSGDVVFSGTSTLHAWSGKVSTNTFTATVILDGNQRPQQLKAKAEVKAKAMDTAEPDRDVKMRAAMKTTEFPLIVADFDTVFTGGIPLKKLPFKLTLLGKTHGVEGAISNWQQTPQQVTFDVDFSLSLKACDIKVPSVLLVVRVGDTIKVHTAITLTPINAASNANSNRP